MADKIKSSYKFSKNFYDEVWLVVSQRFSSFVIGTKKKWLESFADFPTTFIACV